jgi:hypothetical protein
LSRPTQESGLSHKIEEKKKKKMKEEKNGNKYKL